MATVFQVGSDTENWNVWCTKKTISKIKIKIINKFLKTHKLPINIQNQKQNKN
jgi:hypothetical protein